MQILHVIPSVAPSDGGPSYAITAMENSLAAAGVTVVTATTDHALESGVKPVDVTASLGNITRYYARKRTDFYKIAPDLVPWLWANVQAFDAVHIHALFSFSSVAAAFVAHARGVPYIIRPLGTLTAYGMARRSKLKNASFALLEGPLLRRAAAVHFTSEQERADASVLGIPLRGVVIPLGIEDGEPGDASRLEREHPALAGKTAILFLSRVDFKKNIEALFEAYASSSVAHRTSIILIAGSGDPKYLERLKSYARSLGIAECVAWLGHVSGQSKRDVLARAGVFVLPSYCENFGIAAVEAMLAGLPCIFGKNVAVAKLAAADGAAFAITPKAENIAQALDTLILDEELRRAMGRKAREHAKKHYSMETMSKQLVTLYESVMGGRSREAA